MEKKYKNILKLALNSNCIRQDRTKVGCLSLFNQNLSISLNNYFPILTSRYISQKIFETEFLWFLNGETNINRFKKNNIKIWNNWANKNGELGPVYGYQMLNYNNSNINQLNNVINSLKNNKDSRRHIINLWNPEQLNEMALPPCYLYFQFFVENHKLNMFVVQRSGDLFLGIPYDVCLFSMFLLYIAEKTNLKANKINIQIVDAHIYKNQIDAVKEYLEQPIFAMPKYIYKNKKLTLKNYQYSKKITAKVAI